MMQITMNKDLEKEYPDNGFKGLTMTQTLSLVIAAVTTTGIGVFLFLHTALRPNTCVYISLPVGAAMIVIGCYRYQGEMSVFRLMQNIIRTQESGKLIYTCEDWDIRNTRIYSMQRKRGKDEYIQRKAKVCREKSNKQAFDKDTKNHPRRSGHRNIS